MRIEAMVLAIGLAACSPLDERELDVETDTDTDIDTDTDTDADSDTDSPCADGWGAISSPELAVHVRADGDDVGDGGFGAPVATWERAIELARGGSGRIAVGPGDYSTNVALLLDTGAGIDDSGFVIQGCSAAEVRVTAEDPTASVLAVKGAPGVSIKGLTVLGGRRGLAISEGGQAYVGGVVFDGSGRVGVLVSGDGSAAELVDVEVRDPVGDGGFYGWGVAVQNEGALTMTGGRIDNAHEIGLFGDRAILSIDGVTIDGVVANGRGAYGRGVHLQQFASGTVENAIINNTVDAGIFGVQVVDITVSNVSIDVVSAGLVGTDPTGDGIVFTLGGAAYDPADFEAKLYDNTVHGTARAGVLLDDVTAVMDGNVCETSGYDVGGATMFQQGAAAVTGADASGVWALGDTEPVLPVNEAFLLPDDGG